MWFIFTLNLVYVKKNIKKKRIAKISEYVITKSELLIHFFRDVR